jgi:hypothetical protein
MAAESHPVDTDDLATISPYVTRAVRRSAGPRTPGAVPHGVGLSPLTAAPRLRIMDESVLGFTPGYGVRPGEGEDREFAGAGGE